MILEEIEVENFLSHGHSRVSFTNSPLWLINGENGAGKSALFDAFEYALYDEHRGGNQSHELLVKQGARRAKITVVFRHHGIRYRVIREIDYKSGNKGGRLAIWDAEANQWVPENIGDGVKAVRDWLKPKIPNYDLFCSAIFLRQNDTAHFLTGNARHRGERFAALINLDRYTELSEKAKKLAQKAEKDRGDALLLSQILGDLSDDALQQLEELLRGAQDKLTSADIAFQQAQQAARDAEAWALLQKRQQQQEQLAQHIRALLSEEETIRTAAQRVTAWDQVTLYLERYWEYRIAAKTYHTRVAAKRDEVGKAEQKRLEAANSLGVTRKRLEVINQDELPKVRDQAAAAQARIHRLDHERQIAVAQAQVETAQREVKRLAGADTIHVSLQNRWRMLPRLQELAEARARVEEMEQEVLLVQAACNDASQEASAMHEQLDNIERQIEEARQCRIQAAEHVGQLQTEIARLDGQIASHSRLTGQEQECPVCAQLLNESTFHHVQERLQDECIALEQKRTELATQMQPALERAENRIKRLQNEQIEQRKRSKAAAAAEGKTRTRLTAVATQFDTARMDLTRTQGVLLAEVSSLVECIPAIDHVWVANERTVLTEALPAAQAEAQKLQEEQETYRKAHTRVVILGEQRNSNAEPLGDHRASDEIATLVQEATTKAQIYKSRVDELELEHKTLTLQATTLTATCARLAEHVSQGQQQAGQLEAEEWTATFEAEQLYEQLRSAWGTFLEDRTTYDAEKQKIETLRLDATRLAELDQAHGRLQGTEEELKRITAEEEHIRLEHRVPVEQAKQAETDASQHLIAMDHRQRDAVSAIATFHQNRQANTIHRQEMERADRDVTTFSQLADLLKSGGTIQKAIAEQEQRRIAIEANNILALLNDPLHIHIDQARRGKDTQDITIIDTADMASGDANSPNRSHRYFEFISGGEQFRVALALSLALHRLVGGTPLGHSSWMKASVHLTVLGVTFSLRRWPIRVGAS